MMVLAIDPGLDGSACIFNPNVSIASGLRWQFLDVPRLDEDSDRPDPCALRDWIRKWVPDRCYFESVGPMPKQGISSTSKFMRATGYLEATVRCCDIPISMVTPQRWKGFYEVPKGSEKEYSRQLALQLFPELAPLLARKKDHGRAEAALLAFYGAERMKPL